MSQQVQELIDKIKKEGTQVAEQKAVELESQAQAKANKIIEDAKSDAAQLMAKAKADCEKMKESGIMALQQASRDTLLALRKKIQEQLQKVMTLEIRETLSSDQLSSILCEVITSYLSTQEGDVSVIVSPENLEKLKQTALGRLQDTLKKPIHLDASGSVAHGFTISFDGGNSCFDFTDESLSAFLGQYLNQQLQAIVKDSVK